MNTPAYNDRMPTYKAHSLGKPRGIDTRSPFRWPDAGSIETYLKAELRGTHVTAQIHSYDWCDDWNHVIHNRKEYYFSLSMSSDQLVERITSPGSNKECVVGPIALSPADFPIRVQRPPGRRQVLLCIFEPAFFESVTDLRRGWNPDKIGTYYNIKNPFLKSIMVRIQKELEMPSFASTLLLESASDLLLIDLGNYFREGRRAIHEVSDGPGQLSPWQLGRLTERIKSSEAIGWPSLDELANLCGIGRHHLMRQFKASTGETVHQFVEAARLATAKELLTKSKLSTKEIAFRLGFSSSAYFSAAFRRLTATTPTKFRARWTNCNNDPRKPRRHVG